MNYKAKWYDDWGTGEEYRRRNKIRYFYNVINSVKEEVFIKRETK